MYSDDVQGGFQLTSHLISEGHQDIWFIGDVETSLVRALRPGLSSRAWSQQACIRSFSEIHSDDRQLGYLSMRSILSRRDPVTAYLPLLAGSDQILQVASTKRSGNRD